MKTLLTAFALLVVTMCFAANNTNCLRVVVGTNKEVMTAYGLDSVGDGIYGLYMYSTTSAADEDTFGFTVIKPNSITGTGRWLSIMEKSNDKRIQKIIDKDKTK